MYNNRRYPVAFLLLAFFISCNPMKKIEKTSAAEPSLDVQGHRGCRGLFPENSIPAFLHALDLGVTTLELDLAISNDRKVVVSHEPYFNHIISRRPNGTDIPADDQKSHNLFFMDYEEIIKYDVGSKGHSGFPEQTKLKVYKPLLSEVIKRSDEHARLANRSLPWYNIEIKSTEEGDGLFHPGVDEFADLVIEQVKLNKIETRVLIQSFDPRALEAVHIKAPELKLVFLIANELTIDENLNSLSFPPDVYSPYFKLIDAEKVQQLKAKNMQVVPWTVNEVPDIKKMMEIDVDGIISDYPDRVMAVLRDPK